LTRWGKRYVGKTMLSRIAAPRDRFQNYIKSGSTIPWSAEAFVRQNFCTCQA
jgi:hypothetical protein